MKKIIAILSFTLLSICSFAQTNILDAIGINDISIRTMSEYKNNQYFIRMKSGVVSNSYIPSQFTLFKYDKITHQTIDSVMFGGDTLQIDSIMLSISIQMIANNGKINIVYQKKFQNTDFLKGYFIQLDTNMNVITSEKRIVPMENTTFVIQHFIKRHDNSFLLSYLKNVPGTNGYFSKYVILDSIGNSIKDDTFNYKPTVFSNTTRHSVIETYPYGTNQYFVNGENLTTPTTNQDFRQRGYIADSNMNILQPIINIYKGLIQSNAIPLPTGSIIIGGEYPLTDGYSLPFLGKNDVSSNFEFTDTLRYNKIDTFDYYHARFQSLHSLKYNAFDNNIYLASFSHKGYLGQCSNTVDYNYLDIICADTNLIPRWRKFIRFDHVPGYCPVISNVIVPDERGGIIIMGALSQPDSFKEFVYYITDTTVTQDPLPVGIKSPEAVSKDRINIYPQPVQDLINIEDKNGKLAHVQIYNPQGQLVLQQKLSGFHQKVNLSSLSAGVYFIVLELENKKRFHEKIIKY